MGELRQSGEICAPMCIDEGSQLGRIENLNVISSRIKVPCHFQLTPVLERNRKATIVALFHFLFGMKDKAPDTIGRCQREATIGQRAGPGSSRQAFIFDPIMLQNKFGEAA